MLGAQNCLVGTEITPTKLVSLESLCSHERETSFFRTKDLQLKLNQVITLLMETLGAVTLPLENSFISGFPQEICIRMFPQTRR